MFKKLSLGLLLALGIAGAAFAQGTVPQEFINAQTATTYTFVPRDCSKIVTLSNTASIAVTLPQAGVTLFPGCFIDVANIGVGVVTITPTTSTIDGAASKVLMPKSGIFNSGLRIVNNGTNYFTVPMGAPATAVINAQTASYTAIASDCAKFITFSSTGSLTLTLPTPSSTTAFQSGCYFDVKHVGATAATTVTISPGTLTLDGTNASKLLGPGQETRVVTDGSNWITAPGIAGNMFGVLPGAPAGTTLTLGQIGNSGITQVTPSAFMSIVLSDGNTYKIPAYR